MAYKEAMDLANDATEVGNTALANQEKYAESLSGKLTALKTEVETLWLNLYGSEEVGEMVDMASTVVKGISEVISNGDGLNIALISGLGLALAKAIVSVLPSVLASTPVMQTLGTKVASMLGGSLEGAVAGTAGAGVAGAAAIVAGMIGIAIWRGVEQNLKAKAENISKAVESADTAIADTDSIRDYTDLVKELRAKLADSNLTESERYNVKSQLYEIQNKLNETYGEEANQLDLVNGKYEDQIKNLDTLSKKQILEWKGGSQSSKGGFGQTVTTSNKTAGENAKTYLTSDLSASDATIAATVSSGFFSIPNVSKAIKALSYAVNEFDGVSLDWAQNLKTATLGFNGLNPEEIAAIIPSLKKSISATRDKYDIDSADYEIVDNLYTSLSNYETKLNSEIDQATRLSEMLTLSELFEKDDDANLYLNYKEAIENYKEAFANGDNTADAKAEFEKYQAQIDEDTDEWHQRIYQGIYDDFVNTSEGYREQLISGAFGTGGDLNSQVEAIRGYQVDGVQVEDQDIPTLRKTDKEFDKNFSGVEKFFEDLGYDDPTQAAIDHLIKVGAILGEIKDETKDIFNYALKKTEDTINKVDNIKTATDKIGTVFKDLEENKTLSADNYATLYDTFGGETGLSDIDSWMQKISMAKGDVEETEKLINEMVAAWIELKNPAEDIAKADAEIINQSLKEIGATYKDLDATAQAKVNEAVKERYGDKETRALEEISKDEIAALEAEATQLGLTTEAEKNYYLQKILNAFTLDTSGDITALQNVCGVLKIASGYWVKYYKARQGLAELTEISSITDYDERSSRLQSFMETNDYLGSPDLEDAMLENDGKTYRKLSSEEISSVINSATKELEYQQDYSSDQIEKQVNEAIGVEFKGTASGSSGSGSGSTADPEAVEWQERRIKYLEKEHNLLTKIYEDEKELYTERRQAYSDAIGWDQQQIQAYTESKNNWKKLYEDNLSSVIGLTDTEGKNPVTREMIEGIQSGVVAFDAGKYAKDDYDKIKEVLEYYDSFLEADEKIVDLEKEISEHRTAIVESRIQEIEQVLTLQQTEASMLSTNQSIAETTGQLVTEDDYKKMIRNSKSQISSYYDEIDVYEEYLDELEEGSEEYAEVENKIASCNNAILEARAQQAEWNEEIKKIPITRLESYLSSLSRIKALMENMQSEVEATGGTLNADQIQTFISLDSEELETRSKQLAEYQKLINSYEWGSTKYEETESSMQEIESTISSIIVEMTEWNKQILNLPIDKLTESNEKLSTSIEAITEQEEEYNTVIDAVTSSIDEKIDAINKERDAAEEYYDDQIEKIQDVVDALEEENELRDKRLAVEEAEYDLNKAMNQRNVAVIDDNGQTKYIADEDSVRQAQNDLDEAQYAYKIYLLQQEIEKLEDERDELLEQYDDQIEALEDISEKWEKITSNIQLAKDQMVALNYLGEGWLDKVLSGNDQAIFDKFVVEYKENDDMLTAAQDMLDSNNRIITLLQAYVDDYMAGKVSYEEAFANIKAISGYITTGLGVTTNLEETLSYLKGEDFKNFLNTLSSAAQEEADKYGQYLSAVQKNSDYMEDYQVSLNDLSGTISENIKALKASYEAATNQTVATNTLSRTIAAAANISVQGEGISTLGDAYVHHSGINTGYIGATTSDEKLEALKAMTLSPLKPDEMPALLQAGEIVLNRSQQDTLLSNIKKLGANTVNPVIATAAPKSGTVVNMTLSNLTFHEIQNGQDFANYITKNLSSAIAQATY